MATNGGLNEVSQFIVEKEKTSRKLAKVQQRRDHYARLYYRTLAELEDTKRELTQAKHKIRELQQLGTTSPDSGTSLSPAHHWRGTLPLHPKPLPAFTRSLSFHTTPDTPPHLATPPTLHRQLSMPRRLPSSHSMSSFSAFQPLKAHSEYAFSESSQSEVTLPTYNESSTIRGSAERMCREHLSGLEMLDLLSLISSPTCTVTSLEVGRSQLGQPEAMRVFCSDLIKNNSITSLSLPENCIGAQSLPVLLDAVQKCSQLKELLLRNNVIGVECMETIKLFLSHTTLDSLVLTGNDIEQHSHLLSTELPGEFSMEYSEGWNSSGDSGVATREQKHNSLDYMHV